MLLVIPADSPPWALAACADASHLGALLRTGERVPPAFLLCFPLILAPEEIAPPAEKNDLVLISTRYFWIKWAKEKGLRAVWLNPQKDPCPLVHPWHDLELRALEALQTPLRFPLPDLPECLEILRAYRVPENVVRHSVVVAGVAHFLSEKLRERGGSLAPLLAHRGGLLHDLDKIESARENLPHGLPAAERLAKLGYQALGEIARAHVVRPDRLPRTWEEKLVFYADKVVEEDEVVGLEGRLSALRARYPEFAGEIQASEPFLRTLEDGLLFALGLSEPELRLKLQSLEFDLPERVV